LSEVKAALLAPVPEEHLLAALPVEAVQGKVAFGSDAWERLAELQALLAEECTEVYIYASIARVPIRAATWRATFLRYRKALTNRMHPEGMQFRPATTENERWAVYWEVSGLERLSKDERIPMDYFSALGSGKRFQKHFVPRGPTLIERL